MTHRVREERVGLEGREDWLGGRECPLGTRGTFLGKVRQLNPILWGFSTLPNHLFIDLKDEKYKKHYGVGGLRVPARCVSRKAHRDQFGHGKGRGMRQLVKHKRGSHQYRPLPRAL